MVALYFIISMGVSMRNSFLSVVLGLATLVLVSCSSESSIVGTDPGAGKNGSIAREQEVLVSRTTEAWEGFAPCENEIIDMTMDIFVMRKEIFMNDGSLKYEWKYRYRGSGVGRTSGLKYQTNDTSNDEWHYLDFPNFCPQETRFEMKGKVVAQKTGKSSNYVWIMNMHLDEYCNFTFETEKQYFSPCD